MPEAPFSLTAPSCCLTLPGARACARHTRPRARPCRLPDLVPLMAVFERAKQTLKAICVEHKQAGAVLLVTHQMVVALR